MYKIQLEWFDVKCAVLEKLTKSESFTRVSGTRRLKRFMELHNLLSALMSFALIAKPLNY